MTFVRRWANCDMLDALREFAALVDPIVTPIAYQEWASENHQPSASLIARRLGWRRAKQLAGVDFGPLRAEETKYSFGFELWLRSTDEGLHWAINEFLPRLGRSL